MMTSSARPARTRRPGVGFTAACAAALSSISALCGPASANTVTLTCAKADVINSAWNAPLTFAYDGEASGTLKVGGAFGAFVIPAKRSAMEIAGEKGEAIDAVAKARVKLPALADLEKCIGPAEPGDEFANARDACLQKLHPAPSGVDAIAEVRLGMTGPDGSGEDAFVVFKLRYDAPSTAPDGKMAIEAFPAKCTLKK